MTEVRNHLTERITGARLKLEVKRATPGFIALVIALVLTALGLAYLFSQVAPGLVKSDRQVAFMVDRAKNVKAGINEVRFQGIPAGRIAKVELVDGQPVVTASVETKYGPIYNDARAEIRPSTPLQDQYMDIVSRGTPEAGRASPDEPLPPSQTQVPVDINDVLGVFDADSRERLRTLLDDLGNGMDDRGMQLRNTFAEAVPLLDVAGRISRELAQRRPKVERLVHNVGILTEELGRREALLRTLLRDGGQTVRTLQAGRGDLDATLAALPATLSALDSSFAATRGVLPDVNEALRSLSPVADRLPGSLEAVRRLSRAAQPAVDALQAPVRELVPLARTLPSLSARLRKVVDRLRPQTDTVDRTTIDLVKCERGVEGFFHWDASLTKYGDARGLVPRGNVVLGALGSSAIGVPGPDEFAPQACTDGKAIGGRPPDPATDGH